ncbi:VOC family protein [Amycolatopsis sp. DG1A-15b]|uniref:VOC family protein n=1 Tax=Amycolatopsis sp. DG1A-15b TaxID=3052846 RepID=UPI00255B6107|nr:VOC family protein [Amycolatopsis sp. DG1A-15b]WIX90369.1 VOC family protein [Amycolatopsis sp. DG1A-15b]
MSGQNHSAFSSHGRLGYVQLPAADIAASAAFYASVFGWSADPVSGGFEAPGMIGQWTTDLPVAGAGGPVLWICADDLYPTLARVADGGGTVRSRPKPDNGERWLAEIDDPAGNRIGVVVPARRARSQTMIAVRDVEASSRWYQQLLGLRSDHGGPHYERLLSDGVLVLQLHQREVEHHHGLIGDPDREVGNGVLLWFGDVTDFDGAVARARQLGAPVLRAPHRNPPEGEGNGPGHREIWLQDPDGYTVAVASPDGEAFEP